jgi:hypothetical protein
MHACMTWERWTMKNKMKKKIKNEKWKKKKTK